MQTSVNRGYGLDRGAVASAQAFAHSQATSRRSRSALARCASCAERNSLGFTHRRTRLLHALAEDLRARGKLDLSETFIDASFSSAKKGALLSARLAAEKAVKSWRSQTAMVFLSPAASPALRRMKRSSSKLLSSSASRELNPDE